MPDAHRPAPVDLLLTGGCVLTMDDRHRIFDPGAVAVAAGQIVAVGPEAELTHQFRAAERVDVSGHAVLPGLVDTYSHAGHGLIKAIYHPRLGWPGNRVYFHGSTPEWWEAEAELTALERLRFGVTTGHTVLGATPARADDPAYADAHVAGVLRVGIRDMVSLGPPDPYIDHLPRPWTATDWRSGRAVERPFTHERCLDVAEDVAHRWHRAHGGRIFVSLHPPYLFGRQAAHQRFQFGYAPEHVPVVLERAEEMRAAADRLGVIILTHVFKGSVEWGARQFGERFWSVLGRDVLLAHANGLSDAEVDLVARSGCAVVCAPSTGENVWYGVCPVQALLRLGVRVAISTDGNAPRFSMDLWKDIYRALFLQFMHHGDMGAIPAGRALRMVTIEAARCIGLDHLIGSLEPGKQADLIAVDLRQPHLTPRMAIPNLLAYYVEGHDVSTVIVGGRILMRDRRVLTVDPETVVARGQAEAEAAFRRVSVDAFMRFDDTYWTGWTHPQEAT
jgi:cytosine/adenosine deaminase-related metal-dependent hydrolase